LKEENDNFATLTAAHKDLVATIKNEQETVAKAIKILRTAGGGIRDYLEKRVNEGTMVDKEAAKANLA